MWRSLVQSKCEHGSWNPEFGIWDGTPSDPWWFKSEISDADFMQEASKAGLHIQTSRIPSAHLPEELEINEVGNWLVIESQLLLSYRLTDSTNQLRRMASELYSYATHHKICLKNLRVVLYQLPNKTA